MRALGTLLLLLLVVATAACAQEPSTVEQAVVALRAGRSEPAIAGLQAIDLSGNPISPPAQRELQHRFGTRAYAYHAPAG